MEQLIKKPKITLLFLALLLVVGTITFFQLPKREIPEFTFDIGTITTVYPGATSLQVERNVTVPLEEKLKEIEGIKDITSVSAAGISTILLDLESDGNKDATIAKVRQTVSNVSSSFSDEVLTPSIREDIQMGALNSYHLLANNRSDLFELGEALLQWQKEIEAIQGVRGTIVKGVPTEELVIELDSEKLAQKGMILPNVLEALKGEFDPIPLGTLEIEGGKKQLAISTYQTTSEIENIFVGLTRNNEVVTLKDIGIVEKRLVQPRDLITFNGKPALSFTVLPEKGVDIPTIQRAIDQKLDVLKEDLPEGVTIDLFYTQNTIVSQIFKDLSLSFFISILAVIVITLLGMTVTSAIIVALAIPASIILGLIPLPYLGVDLNQISLIGFIIALGILVDDAIVVNDNIQRRYKLGDSALEGALKGTREVRVSIITSTLAIVFTFFPLLFLSGGNGDFIRALPSVLITTIIASTVISLTLVPIFTSWRRTKSIQKGEEKIGLLGKQMDHLANWYSDKILGKVINAPIKTSIIGLLICTFVYGLVPFIPIVFFPSADREEVTVDVTLPIGETLSSTNETLEGIATLLKGDQAVKEVSIYAGAGLPGLFGQVMSGTGENTGQLLIRVDKEVQTADETINIWTDELRKQYPNSEIKMTTIETGPPAGAPIAIKISGPEIDELVQIVDDLKKKIKEIEGSGAVIDDIGTPWQTIVYEPDRDNLEKYGFTVRQISEQIRLITDGLPLGSFDDGSRNWDLRIVVDEVATGQPIDLDKIFLPSKQNREGFGTPELVPLQQLVVAKEIEQIQKIPHINGERTITLRAYPGAENKTQLESSIKEIIEELQITEDYTVIVGGESEARTDFFIEITKLFFIVVFLIYIVMAIQFYSLVTPLLVMSTVYLAISGAILGLFVTQVGLGFMAMMGIVSLAGIVVRNSIVLIEFIEQRLNEGMRLNEAVIEAGRARLRPILLTAFTAIAALIPLALSGDVLFKPLAISIISGLLFSTVFTVVLVPAFYTAINRKKMLSEKS